MVLSAGAVSVRVKPDLTKFAAELKAFLVAASRDVVHIGADLDAGKLATQVKAAVTRAGAGRGVEVPVTADTTKLAAAVRSGTPSGKTSVAVDADTSTALSQVARLKSQLDDLSRRHIELSASGDTAGAEHLVAQIRDAAAAAQEIDLSHIKGAALGVDTKAARAAAEKLRTDLARLSGETFRIDVTANAGDVERVRAELHTLAADASDIDIPVAADTSKLAAQVRSGLAAADGGRVRVPVAADAGQLAGQVRRAAALAQQGTRITVPVGANTKGIGGSLAGLSGIGGALAGIGKVAAIGTSLAAAAGGAAQLAAALAPVAGALAALPAFALGAAGAFAVLKLGLSGVGAALSGDSAAFAQLAPSAQAAVTAIRGLSPQFERLKTSIQGNLFAGLDKQITRVADVLLPKLQQRLPAIATAFNGLAKGVAGGLSSDGFTSGLDAALSHTATGIAGLAKGMRPLFSGLGQVIGAFAPSLTAAGQAAGGLAARFGEFISKAAETGQLASFVDGVKTALSQVGGILSNLGSVVASVFSAASSSGGGLLATLETITGAAREFFSSLEGQEALSGFFGGIQSVVRAVLPTLQNLASGIGSVLGPAVGQIATILGPALETLSGSLVDGVAKLLPGLMPVAEALASIVTAAAPLLGVAGQLGAILGGILGSALSMVASLFQALVPPAVQIAQILLASLMPAWRSIESALQTVIAAVLPVIQAFLSVNQALAPILGLIVRVAAAILSGLVKGLIALITPSLTITKIFVGALAKGIATVYGWLKEKLGPAAAWLASVWNEKVSPALSKVSAWLSEKFSAAAASAWSWIKEKLAPLGQKLATIWSEKLAPAIQKVGLWFREKFVPAAQQVWTWIQEKVIPVVSKLVRWFVSKLVPGIERVVEWLVDLAGWFLDLAVDIGTAVGKAIRFWGRFIAFIKALPGKVIGFLKGLPAKFVQIGKNIVSGIVRGIKQAAGRIKDAAVGAAKSAYEGAKDFLGINSPSRLMAWLGSQMGAGVEVGLDGSVGDVVSASRGLARAAYDPWRGFTPHPKSRTDTDGPGGVNVSVRIGEREVADMVVDAVRARPEAVASTVAHGTRLSNLRR
ncbi:phage tail protein [Stackebrandtia nassauensis]|uniref:Phage-related protein-like protein n=1 Tax=Stackebrandtia nassauensis (strain DSM 44728 / CIP 108903 / NRRL B-16338 / NBRC 102104 / LLR-40K-21) TaxID=446470 RepID=D3Q2F1_STANL|nr:hypothetical protein [Stackebrandtia nassauensis]ADD43884.1 hypothetical protein Snas_4235 [Stackebrandtia nassauensis DSM 44728]